MTIEETYEPLQAADSGIHQDVVMRAEHLESAVEAWHERLTKDREWPMEEEMKDVVWHAIHADTAIRDYPRALEKHMNVLLPERATREE